MPKWEYKYIYTEPLGSVVLDQNNVKLDDNLSSYLTDVGLEGWEIIEILSEVKIPGTINMMIFFKRKISE